MKAVVVLMFVLTYRTMIEGIPRIVPVGAPILSRGRRLLRLLGSGGMGQRWWI
jgi:hypothetical protein